MQRWLLSATFVLVLASGAAQAKAVNERLLTVKQVATCLGRSYCSAAGLPPCAVCCPPRMNAVCSAGGPGYSASCKCQWGWLPF